MNNDQAQGQTREPGDIRFRSLLVRQPHTSAETPKFLVLFRPLLNPGLQRSTACFWIFQNSSLRSTPSPDASLQLWSEVVDIGAGGYVKSPLFLLLLFSLLTSWLRELSDHTASAGVHHIGNILPSQRSTYPNTSPDHTGQV